MPGLWRYINKIIIIIIIIIVIIIIIIGLCFLLFLTILSLRWNNNLKHDIFVFALEYIL